MSYIGNLNEFADYSATSRLVDQLSLLVVRRNGDLYIYENRCPHTRESLDPGGGSIASSDALLIHCQRHAAEFRADTGECVAGPCLGESLTPLGFTISDGAIYLD